MSVVYSVGHSDFGKLDNAPEVLAILQRFTSNGACRGLVSKESLLSAIDSKAVNIVEVEGSTQAGVIHVELREVVEEVAEEQEFKYKCYVPHWDTSDGKIFSAFHQKNVLLNTLHAFTQKLCKNVILNEGTRKESGQLGRNAGMFYIRNCDVAIPLPEYDRQPKEIAGIKTNLLTISPTQYGRVFKDPQSGVVLAELIEGNHLYILFNVFNSDVFTLEQSNKVFEMILNAVLEDKFEEQEVDCEQLFIDKCLGNSNKLLERYTAEASLSEQRCKELELALTKEKRKYLEAQHIIQRLDRDVNGEKYKKDFATINRLPQIRKVIIDNKGKLGFFTNDIKCSYIGDDEVYNIGRFYITVDDSDFPEGNKFYNMTDRLTGQQAPHVWSGGDPCYGQNADLFTDVMAQRDYVSLANIIVQFLENATPGDQLGGLLSEFRLEGEPRREYPYDGLTIPYLPQEVIEEIPSESLVGINDPALDADPNDQFVLDENNYIVLQA